MEVKIKNIEEEKSKLFEKYEDDFKSFKERETSAMDADIKKYEEEKSRSLKKLEKEKTIYKEWFDQRKEMILSVCQSFLTDQRLIDGIRKKKENQFSFDAFESVDSMPIYLDQGYLSCQFDSDILEKIPKEIMETIWGWMEGFNCTNEHYIIKLPNVERECQGTAYFLDMDTEQHVDDIRMLVLSILMQYPPGKMDLVICVPEGKDYFAKLEQLGEENVHKWGRSEGFRRQLSELMERLNKMKEQYGEAVNKCLKEQKRTLVVIADFPREFNEEIFLPRDEELNITAAPEYKEYYNIIVTDD